MRFSPRIDVNFQDWDLGNLNFNQKPNLFRVDSQSKHPWLECRE